MALSVPGADAVVDDVGSRDGHQAATRPAMEPVRNDPEMVGRFFDLLSHIYQQVRAGPLDLWEDLELTRAQLRTLALLSEGPDRMTSIATRLGISLPAATGLIDRLVGKGLVERERDADDRRAVVCTVAAEGRRALDRFSEVGRDEFEEVVRWLTPRELEKVVAGVALIVEAIDRADADRRDGSS